MILLFLKRKCPHPAPWTIYHSPGYETETDFVKRSYLTRVYCRRCRHRVLFKRHDI